MGELGEAGHNHKGDWQENLVAGRFRTGRVERRRDRFRPMASCVSALSSIVANSPRVMPTFPPPSLFIPYGGFSPVRLEASLVLLRTSITLMFEIRPGGISVGIPDRYTKQRILFPVQLALLCAATCPFAAGPIIGLVEAWEGMMRVDPGTAYEQFSQHQRARFCPATRK